MPTVFFHTISCKSGTFYAILTVESVTLILQLNPNSMKSNAHSSLYFSAYPLKAIKQASDATSTQSPYLRSVLSAGKTRSGSRVRVFPMSNPYKKPVVIAKPVKPVKDIGIGGDGWFNNYE
jgi:hypothetical protein